MRQKVGPDMFQLNVCLRDLIRMFGNPAGFSRRIPETAEACQAAFDKAREQHGGTFDWDELEA